MLCQFRGREMEFKQIAFDLFNRFLAEVKEEGMVESGPSLEGRSLVSACTAASAGLARVSACAAANLPHTHSTHSLLSSDPHPQQQQGGGQARCRKAEAGGARGGARLRLGPYPRRRQRPSHPSA